MNKIKNSCFDEFINNISPTSDEHERIKTSHKNIRKILEESKLSSNIVKTILTGSYKMKTDIKTLESDDKKVDVDIAVIFSMNTFDKPQVALDKIYDILNSEYNYKDKLERQKRSIGVSLSKTHVDVVPFQEVTQDSDQPLYISSLDKQKWDDTNPIGHIEYFQGLKSDKPNFSYFVRALKWYNKINKPESVRYPKGVAYNQFVSEYYDYNPNKFEALINIMKKISEHPNAFLSDPVTIGNNLLSRLDNEDFESYKIKLNKKINIIIDALKTKNIEPIRKIFGIDFPKCEIFDEEDKRTMMDSTKNVTSFGI